MMSAFHGAREKMRLGFESRQSDQELEGRQKVVQITGAETGEQVILRKWKQQTVSGKKQE